MKTIHELGRVSMILAVPALIAAAALARTPDMKTGWHVAVSLTPSQAHVSAQAGRMASAVLLDLR